MRAYLLKLGRVDISQTVDTDVLMAGLLEGLDTLQIGSEDSETLAVLCLVVLTAKLLQEAAEFRVEIDGMSADDDEEKKTNGWREHSRC